MAAAGEENAQERRRAAPRLKGLWTCAVAVARQAGVRSPWPAPSCTGTDPQPWQSHKQLSQPSHDPAVWVWLGFFFRTVFRSACVPSLSPGAAEHVVSRLRDRGPRAGAARPVTMDDRTCRWAGRLGRLLSLPTHCFFSGGGGHCSPGLERYDRGPLSSPELGLRSRYRPALARPEQQPCWSCFALSSTPALTPRPGHCGSWAGRP